jgi:hypothetical protein
MARWVTVAEIKAIIGLNDAHTSDIDFQQYIDRAQVRDILPLLGDRLYADIDGDQTKTSNGSYPDLLDGSNYTDGGYTFVNHGLKTVIAYFAAAEYRFDGQEIDTPYGFAEVEAGNLSKSSRERNREMSIHYRELAMVYWQSVRDYLQRKADEYTLWYGDQPEDWDKSSKRNTVQPVTLW